MYLTEPQSPHFDATRFAGAARNANHFDWELYYRFKDERDAYWMEQLASDAEFQQQAREHVRAFDESIERTRALLRPVARPRILDIGLSSEKLDGSLIDTLGARLTVVDVEAAAEDYLPTAASSSAMSSAWPHKLSMPGTTTWSTVSVSSSISPLRTPSWVRISVSPRAAVWC